MKVTGENPVTFFHPFQTSEHVYCVLCVLCVIFIIPAGRFAKTPLEICINHPMWKTCTFITKKCNQFW